MAVLGHFRQRSKFWGLLRGLTEIYGSFFVLNVWRLSLRSYRTDKKLIGSFVAMATRSKLVIFSRILTTQFFKATRALWLFNTDERQSYRCIEQEILYYNCFQNFLLSVQNFPLAALKLRNQCAPWCWHWAICTTEVACRFMSKNELTSTQPCERCLSPLRHMVSRSQPP